MESGFSPHEDYACKMDSKDPLARFRERFYINPGEIYMDGNSLGLLSRDAEKSTLKALEEWKSLGIRGWLDGKPPWFYYGEQLGALAAGLVGARPEEIACTGTTTVNLHSLVSTFFRPRGKKTKIIADELDFPSDVYALNSQVRLKGLDPKKHLVLVPSEDGRTISEKKVVELLTDEVALVLLPSVLYRSGQLLDIPFLTEEAHKRGIIIGWDCCHSVGAVPHFFDRWNVDFAFWCSYKYLNAGPGGSGFLYVNERHFGERPALSGWFGYVKEKQFDMSLEFENALGAGGWQISSPPILSSASLEGSLELILEAGLENIREKSLKLTSYLMRLLDDLLSGAPYNFTIGTPRETERRGGHVAVEHEDAMRIGEALRRRGIVPDFRPPNIIRIAPVALYNTYHEVWEVAQALKEIIDKKENENFPKGRKEVS